MRTFAATNVVLFEALLGWECLNACHDLRANRKSIYIEEREHENCNWHTIDLQI